MNKLIIAGCLVLGIVGCAQKQPRMGEALEEMVQAQTDPEVSTDNVGGSMAGIGDRVGATYRGAVDRPEQVKESMSAFGRK